MICKQNNANIANLDAFNVFLINNVQNIKMELQYITIILWNANLDVKYVHSFIRKYAYNAKINIIYNNTNKT